MKQAISTLLLLVLLGAGPATQPLPQITINRSDFVAAVLRFEDAYLARPPQAAQDRALVHRAFDEAIYLNLSNRLPEAIERLNQLCDLLDPAPPGTAALRSLVRSLQVRVSPPIGWRNRPGILRARIARMYRVDTPLPVDLRLVIRADTPEKQVYLDEPVKIEDSGPPYSLTRAGPEAPMGKYIVELVGPDSISYPVDRWTVVEVSLDIIKQSVTQQTAGLRPETPEMSQALVALAARASLLSDRPDLNTSSQFLPDPLELARAVQSETENLLLGRNPYTDRLGDWWRAIQAGAMQVPTRVYAPQRASTRQPMPLVIALQGGGWDENLFFEAIGRGKIRKLADQYGFVVVSPSAFWLRNNLAAFEGIIEAMSTTYAIDPNRIYVIGHSSGGAVAAQLAGRDAHRIAAMTLISGADFNEITRLPRTRLYNGALDPFFPPDQAQATVAAARRAGLPVELKTVENAGHLLVANDVLEEAVKWMVGGE